ncbi:MAG: hypothetical protein F6J92_12905 [Symploca sp. SIO1A3]|nr:hypothetical protein [Symploca sp. SIO1A3]
MAARKRPTIKEQARIRKAAAEAKKATKTTKTKTTPAKSKTTATKSSQTTNTSATKTKTPAATKLPLTNGNGNGAKLTTNTSEILVPGLTTVDPGDIVGMLPQFDATSYNITDPLKPPSNLPQISESDFDAGMNTYQGAIRALKLTGTAFDVTRERFTTEGKKAKAFGAGVKAATEFEKVKADYLDHLTQLETNTQKESGLSLAIKRTQFVQNMAVESEAEMAEKLESAKVGAEIAKLQRQDKQSKLDEFKKQLNGEK